MCRYGKTVYPDGKGKLMNDLTPKGPQWASLRSLMAKRGYEATASDAQALARIGSFLSPRLTAPDPQGWSCWAVTCSGDNLVAYWENVPGSDTRVAGETIWSPDESLSDALGRICEQMRGKPDESSAVE